MLTVQEIETMDRAALIAAWDAHFCVPVPKSLSKPFLRRFLAFEIQARRYGGLPKTFLADLERRVAGDERSMAPALAPGGRPFGGAGRLSGRYSPRGGRGLGAGLCHLPQRDAA